MNIEEAKRQFEILDGYRQEALFSLKNVKAADKHGKIYNNTYEAHILNHIAWVLYQDLVLNLRKVVEPKGKGKHVDRPSLDVIIDFLKKEKVSPIIGEISNEWETFKKSNYAEKLMEARHKIAHSNKEVEVVHPPIKEVKEILKQITSILKKIDRSLFKKPLSYSREEKEVNRMANNFWKAASYGYNLIGDKDDDNI